MHARLIMWAILVQFAENTYKSVRLLTVLFQSFQYTFQYCISECAVDRLIPTDLHTFPYYEFEFLAAAPDGSTNVSVQGRLKESVAFWLSNLETSHCYT